MSKASPTTRRLARAWELWAWRLAAWAVWGYFIGVVIEEFGGR